MPAGPAGNFWETSALSNIFGKISSLCAASIARDCGEKAVAPRADGRRREVARTGAPELPIFEKNRSEGSTGEVSFWTTREICEAVRSHVNYVVADTRQWEESAAYLIDTHLAVDAFVKNAGLGFAIPYFDNGRPLDYEPDFIIHLKGGGKRFLILETKGYDKLAEVKEQTASQWVAAVNAEGRHGSWQFAMIRRVGDLGEAIDAARLAVCS